jgi:hypothetical protein
MVEQKFEYDKDFGMSTISMMASKDFCYWIFKVHTTLEGMCKDTEEPNPVQHMYV